MPLEQTWICVLWTEPTVFYKLEWYGHKMVSWISYTEPTSDAGTTQCVTTRCVRPSNKSNFAVAISNIHERWKPLYDQRPAKNTSQYLQTTGHPDCILVFIEERNLSHRRQARCDGHIPNSDLIQRLSSRRGIWVLRLPRLALAPGGIFWFSGAIDV